MSVSFSVLRGVRDTSMMHGKFIVILVMKLAKGRDHLSAILWIRIHFFRIRIQNFFLPFSDSDSKTTGNIF
jgi:hypothetical protein